MVGIAFSLIPASIASRLVLEKEKGLYHMQVVSGIDKLAYYGCFLSFDLVFSYIPVVLAIILFKVFSLDYSSMHPTLLLYPFALVPYTYTWSMLFHKETTAQTYTIYLHFLLAAIASMIIYALRMVEATCVVGDFLL